MPRFVVDKLLRKFAGVTDQTTKTRIVLLGVSYKANVSDIRETPAIEILRYLREENIESCFYDPLVPEFIVDGIITCRLNSLREIEQTDLVLLLQGHKEILENLASIRSDNLLDTSGSLESVPSHNPNWSSL
jgi:UDP-N-acetyl-D-mannosaminuronate dehydrogenase